MLRRDSFRVDFDPKNSENIFGHLNDDTTHSLPSRKENVKPKTTYIPTRSTKPLTIPKEFSFSNKKPTKTSFIRHSSPVIKKRKTGKKRGELTIPKPFNFHSTLKRVGNDVSQTEPYKPLAVLLKEVEGETPERFKQNVLKKTRLDKIKRGLTQPMSPKLFTKLRFKSQNVKPTEEMVLEQARKAQFKAQPLNKRILEASYPLGVPTVEKPHPTIPQSPVPNISKPKKPLEPEPSPPRIIKANPVRKIPQFHVEYSHKHTEPVDFRLPGDEISQKKKEKFKQQIDEIFEELEAYRRFHAQPLPDSSPDSLPQVARKMLTRSEPFHLETEERGEMYQRYWEEKLAHEEQEQEEMKRFHAQPLPSHAPFIPKKSTKAPTEPEPILLHTDVRVEDRRAFDDEIKRKMEIEEMYREHMEREQRKHEEEEIRKLRKELVHRAQPVKNYASIRLKPSSKKLTDPRSPFIGKKRIMAMREMKNHLETSDEN